LDFNLVYLFNRSAAVVFFSTGFSVILLFAHCLLARLPFAFGAIFVNLGETVLVFRVVTGFFVLGTEVGFILFTGLSHILPTLRFKTERVVFEAVVVDFIVGAGDGAGD